MGNGTESQERSSGEARVKQAVALGLKLKELVIIPELAADFKILPISARTTT
jgi:hypothetical protein